MKRSWAHPLSVGYEIKVSRNDFLRDDKWHSYLEYCNTLYFVCPPEIIKPDELSPEVGLLWVSKNGKMLMLKKKAHYREVTIPESFYQYILMCRVKITASAFTMHDDPDHKYHYWKQWLSEKMEKQDIGNAASKRIQEIVLEKIGRAERDNEKLRSEIEAYKEIREFADSVGFDFRGWRTAHDAKEKIKEIMSVVPREFIDHVDGAIQGLTKIREHFQWGTTP
jgi:hypothetical protein